MACTGAANLLAARRQPLADHYWLKSSQSFWSVCYTVCYTTVYVCVLIEGALHLVNGRFLYIALSRVENLFCKSLAFGFFLVKDQTLVTRVWFKQFIQKFIQKQKEIHFSCS